MFSINILNKIDSLPPLPKTIIEVEEFRKKPNKEIADLLKIIEKDALIVSTLLKISNSAMFGFRSRVETPARAVSLLGINFTISIAIAGTVQNLLKSDLEPYGVNVNDFMKASNTASILANLWLSKIDLALKEEIVLPALLQETGKFILADYIKQENLSETFREKVDSCELIEDVERNLLGITTSQVTAQIFRHWKLSDKLVNMIENVDNISNVSDEYKKQTQILEVIKTAAYIKNPLSDENVKKAIEKASKYKLDITSLKNAITTLKDRVDNML
ncbi:HDOD domain-containing protein [Aliarcobacter butzleri]|uniref:HDOD domain-containing protein n=1 Tax=Aliarcobacter butzleri TaxID=28197 RepID=UPI001EDC4F81|nr:HDOD domain-containing protein [Aliarcobacter butzleri]MCG3685723.1 HDOD domain-containing protein [Aliarcobacter butzleri]MCT7563652.1 HDOD domain-containing protein [Aliarcobacter butzleri]MCT7565706.1 HDOD domain-containing protein [Aliarcobacter butzleri]MCT7572502.1 HDOD domain-containing protein [Aliarcobacter butzleri]MCT7596793.1 HDOD domain-containing protein [Aliarcobacter butzleri]